MVRVGASGASGLRCGCGRSPRAAEASGRPRGCDWGRREPPAPRRACARPRPSGQVVTGRRIVMVGSHPAVAAGPAGVKAGRGEAAIGEPGDDRGTVKKASAASMEAGHVDLADAPLRADGLDGAAVTQADGHMGVGTERLARARLVGQVEQQRPRRVQRLLDRDGCGPCPSAAGTGPLRCDRVARRPGGRPTAPARSSRRRGGQDRRVRRGAGVYSSPSCASAAWMNIWSAGWASCASSGWEAAVRCRSPCREAHDPRRSRRRRGRRSCP